MRSFYTDKALVKRPAMLDDNGTPIPDYSVDPAETFTATGRHQYLSTAAETTSHWLGAVDLEIRITDRLVFAGKTFEPTGPSIPQRSPHGLASHSITPLKES